MAELDLVTKKQIEQIATSLRTIATQQKDTNDLLRIIAHYFEQESKKK